MCILQLVDNSLLSSPSPQGMKFRSRRALSDYFKKNGEIVLKSEDFDFNAPIQNNAQLRTMGSTTVESRVQIYNSNSQVSDLGLQNSDGGHAIILQNEVLELQPKARELENISVCLQDGTTIDNLKGCCLQTNKKRNLDDGQNKKQRNISHKKQRMGCIKRSRQENGVRVVNNESVNEQKTCQLGSRKKKIRLKDELLISEPTVEMHVNPSAPILECKSSAEALKYGESPSKIVAAATVNNSSELANLKNRMPSEIQVIKFAPKEGINVSQTSNEHHFTSVKGIYFAEELTF